MKSDSKRINSNIDHLASLGQVVRSSPYSSGHQRKVASGLRQKQSPRRKQGEKPFLQEKPVVLLSKSMEKSFLALKNPDGREAYVEAELINGLARQIRIIRKQRGWSQKDLAEHLNTTQAAISRLEDPSYGKYSMSTLLELAKAFNVALYTRFMPFSKFMPLTWNTKPEAFEAESFNEEVSNVQFYSESATRRYVAGVKTASVSTQYAAMGLIEKESKALADVTLNQSKATFYQPVELIK